MKSQQETRIEQLVYYRLIALWILCEVMLGGIIHGAKIPASGLIVGSCAVICISLISYHAPSKGSILKATMIVAIFKMMLSPQAPPPAYFAVLFQGLIGEVLFWNRKTYPLSCLLFGILVLLESGLQRIVVLTIVYGNDLWQAINIFINGITRQTILINYSFFFIIGYVLIHIIVGILVGFWAGRLPQKIHSWIALHKEYLLTTDINDTNDIGMPLPSKRIKKLRKSAIFIWLVLLLLYIQSSVLLPPNMPTRIFIRSILIMLTCYFLVWPSLSWLLNTWLQKNKIRENEMIQNILKFLPHTKQLVSKSWQLTAHNKGGRRILLCGKIILLNTLHSPYD